MSLPADPVAVTPEVLARFALPRHGDSTSKYERGTVIVLGGSVRTPGAVLLAGVAALRAGAGRLVLATVRSVAPALAMAVPEAGVLALPESADGSIDSLDRQARDRLGSCDAVLIGPGLDGDATDDLLAEVCAAATGTVVIDSGALAAAGRNTPAVRSLKERALLTPNDTELDRLFPSRELPDDAARHAAVRYDAVVTVRGAETSIAGPDSELFVDRHGCAGLATSGSGDVAVGIAAGLAARGAAPLAAALWSAAVHGLAGERLAARVAPIGFLARELLEEIPIVLDRLETDDRFRPG